MKLALRLGLALLGLLVIGGGGFIGWRYYLSPQTSERVTVKGKSDAKSSAAGATAKAAAASSPDKSAPSAAPTSDKAATAPAPEKQAAAAAPDKTQPAPATSEKPATAPAPDKAPAAEAAAARDPEQERLIRLYGGMRPKEAAAVMGQLDPALGVTILAGLQERQAAKILGQLPPKTAADLITRMSQGKRPAETAAPAAKPRAGEKS